MIHLLHSWRVTGKPEVELDKKSQAGQKSACGRCHQIGTAKRPWRLSCDETPLPRENVMPCRLIITNLLNFVEARSWITSCLPTILGATRQALNPPLDFKSNSGLLILTAVS